MKYGMFFFYLLACALGFTAFTISVLLYYRHRKQAILLYALFLGSLGLVVGAYAVWMATPVFNLQDHPSITSYLATLGRVFEFLGVTGYISVTCIFVHHLMGVPITRKRQRLFLAAPVVSTLSYGLWRISGSELVVHGIFLPLVYGIAIYSLVLIFYHLSAIGDRLLKRAIQTFLILSGVFMPVYILETSADILPHVPLIPSYCFSLPVYFFILNSLGILFAFRFFDRPAYLEGDTLSEHFKTNFNLSARESEITSQVISGLSNREIGDKLYISFKTVENHLYNIYRKTGVHNRVQLVNLIQTNKKA